MANDQPDFTTGSAQNVGNTLVTSVSSPFASPGVFQQFGGDLSSYQSIIPIWFTSVGPAAISWEWIDDSGLYTLGSGSIYVAVASLTYAWRLRVLSKTLKMAGQGSFGALTSQLGIFASNYSIPKDDYGQPAPTAINQSQAWVSGTPVNLATCISHGGLFDVTAGMNLAAAKGTITATYTDTNNVVQTILVADSSQFFTNANGTLSYHGTLVLPPGVVQLTFTPRATNTWAVTCVLSPQRWS